MQCDTHVAHTLLYFLFVLIVMLSITNVVFITKKCILYIPNKIIIRFFYNNNNNKYNKIIITIIIIIIIRSLYNNPF